MIADVRMNRRVHYSSNRAMACRTFVYAVQYFTYSIIISALCCPK